MSHIVLTDSNFTDEVEKSSTPVLVDFWASWCGPCLVQAPVIEELAGEYEGKVKVGKLEVDQNQQTAAKFNVMSIPTLCVFKDGKVVRTLVGAQGKDTLKQAVEKFL